MGNSVLSILILGGFFGFLLIVSHLAIRNLIKGYKLEKKIKMFDGTRTSQSKPIYIQRGRTETIHDISSVQEWQDMGILSVTKGRSNPKEFKDNSETDS
jgi:hypothetical protein